MKKTIGAVALFTFALTHQGIAGSLADPVIEAPVIVEEASSSSSGTATVALLALLMSLPLLTD